MTDANYNALIFTCVFFIGLFPFIKDPWKREPAVNGFPVWYKRPNWSVIPMLVFFLLGLFVGWQKDKRDEEDKTIERAANAKQRKDDSTLAANRHSQDSTALWTIIGEVRDSGFAVDTATWQITKIVGSYNNTKTTTSYGNATLNSGILNYGAFPTFSGNQFNSGTDGPPETTPIPVQSVKEIELQKLTSKLLEARLPMYSEGEFDSLFNSLKMASLKKNLSKNAVLAIDKKSNGVIIFYQLYSKLLAHGYQINSLETSNLKEADLNKMQAITAGKDKKNRTLFIVGKIK